MQSLFFLSIFLLTEIWFFYESYLQYAEYLLFPRFLLLLTVDGIDIPFNAASHISQRDE